MAEIQYPMKRTMARPQREPLLAGPHHLQPQDLLTGGSTDEHPEHDKIARDEQ